MSSKEKEKQHCPNCMQYLSLIEAGYNGDILNFYLGYCSNCRKTVSILCKDVYCK